VQTLRGRPTFLMVGTLEPRKGHLQVLDAMECLWARGMDINLVIVGREGWLHTTDDQRRSIPELMRRLRGHRELGKRLFWEAGIGEAALESIYAASTCLIAASEAEGFGLPLIEAAQHGLPVIARDIPVFREVAGEFAFYFEGEDGDTLAGAITQWLALRQAGTAPRSADMPWLSWAESARRLQDIMLGAVHEEVRQEAAQ
jgi:glycosyltransferase involved in cell wall biosynthesis